MIDRIDFADAIVTFARNRDRGLQDRIREGHILDVTNESLGYRGPASEREERDDLRGLEPGAAIVYLALVAKHCSEADAVKLANDLHRIASVDGVTIQLETSDDDPTQCTAHISDELADEWADYHGSLDGGTWECADGPDFVYDILNWYPGQIEKLQSEGYDFDFSNYSEPDEHDIAVAIHASECGECEYDWHKGEEHLALIEAEPLFHREAK